MIKTLAAVAAVLSLSACMPGSQHHAAASFMSALGGPTEPVAEIAADDTALAASNATAARLGLGDVPVAAPVVVVAVEPPPPPPPPACVPHFRMPCPGDE